MADEALNALWRPSFLFRHLSLGFSTRASVSGFPLARQVLLMCLYSRRHIRIGIKDIAFGSLRNREAVNFGLRNNASTVTNINCNSINESYYEICSLQVICTEKYAD